MKVILTIVAIILGGLWWLVLSLLGRIVEPSEWASLLYSVGLVGTACIIGVSIVKIWGLDKEEEPTKYFVGGLEITCGEYEFHYPYAIEAKDYPSACEIMDNYAKNFYHGGYQDDDKTDSYYFNGGEVAITYTVSDAITKEAWLNWHWNRFHVR